MTASIRIALGWLLASPFLCNAQTVVAWGDNLYGKCNVPASATNVVAVAAGARHSMASRRDGSVVCWGQINTVPSSVTNVVRIAAGDRSVALREDGTAIIWSSSSAFYQFPGATNIVDIAGGGVMAHALTRDGRVLSAYNSMTFSVIRSNACAISACVAGLSEDPVIVMEDTGAGYLLKVASNPARSPIVQRVFGSDLGIADISAGPWQHLGLKPGGDLWSKGGFVPPGVSDFIAVATQTNYSLGLKADGTLLAWGTSPVVTNYVSLSNVLSLSAGSTHALALITADSAPAIHGNVAYRKSGFLLEPLPLWVRASGSAPISYYWYLNGEFLPDADGPTPNVPAVELGTTFVQVVASNAFGCVTSAMHSVSVRSFKVYGSDNYFQTTAPGSVYGSRSLASGAFHHIAFTTNDTVICWGKNSYGQATNVANTTNICQAAAGAEHSLALRRDGKILGWGSNLKGQLGITNYRGNFVAISAGAGHSMALKDDGTLVAAGDRSSGQADIGLLSGDVTSIASGYWHNIALRADGSVLTAGLEYPIPASVSNVVAVAAGWESCAALRADGTGIAWGDNSQGQCNVPPDATNLVAISGGSFHYAGTRADGTVVTWGREYRGTTQIPESVRAWNGVSCGEDVTIVDASSVAPEIGLNVSLLSAVEGSPLVIPARFTGSGPLSFQWFRNSAPIQHGTNRFLFISSASLADAGIYSLLVSNELGQDFGPITTVQVKQCGGQPHSIAAWQNAADTRPVTASGSAVPVCAVSVGGYHILTLDVRGRVHASGKNLDGQTQVPQAATNIVAIAAGGDHSLALTEKGTVLAWGRNWDGQCDVPMGGGSWGQWIPARATNIIAIAAGWAHSLALRADGAVLAWGNGDYGQTYVSPVAVEVLAIAAGWYHSMALRSDGHVAVWGLDAPVPENAVNVTAIAAGREHCLALRADGTVVAWGDNRYGQCDVPAIATNVVAISAGFFRSTALRADGVLITWGAEQTNGSRSPTHLGLGSLSTGEYFDSILPPAPGAPQFGRTLQNMVTSPNAGKTRLALNLAGADPMDFQWYLNDAPISGATNRWLDVNMESEVWAGIYSMRATNQFGFATSPSVNVVANDAAPSLTVIGGWGADGVGQLRVPAGLENAVTVAAGGFHCVALKSDGTLSAWGKNSDGQTAVPSPPPRLGSRYIKVAAGSDHNLALTDSGLVVGWGRNWDGQATPPPEIDGWQRNWEPPATTITRIDAGFAHSIALTSDGKVLAWGNNELCQTNVPFFSAKVLEISAGYYHNLALLANGKVAVWGLMDRLPAQPIINPVAVNGGWWHSLVLQADGKVIAWGDNTFGQCNVPPDATNIVAISAGYYASYALRADGTVISWGSTRSGVRNIPAGLKNVSSLSAGEDFAMVIVEKGEPWLASPLGYASLHVGESFTIVPETRGTSPLTYQWHLNGAPIEGETHAALMLTNVQTSAAGNYELAVINNSGQSQTFSTIVAISRTPSIVPINAPPVPLGETIHLAPIIYGETTGMQYNWLHNGTPMQDNSRVHGAHSPVLSIESAGYQDNGTCTLHAFNQFGSQTRPVAEIDVSSVVGFGYNYAGQITIPSSAKDAVAVAAAGDHSLALKPDGTLVAWGDPAFGKNDVPSDRATNIVAIANRGANSLALTADGSVICWGSSGNGLTSVPASATNVVGIALGYSVAYAWREDGSLVRWGWSPWSLNPSNVVVDIASSYRGTIGLLPSGRLAVSGFASPPATLTNIVRIAAGLNHFLALGADGNVFAWGSNVHGQGTVPDGLQGVVGVEAGDDFSLVVLNDGRVISWGGVIWSETNFDPVPVPDWVSGLRDVSAGSSHCLGLAVKAPQPAPLACTVQGNGPLFLTGASRSINSRYQWYQNGLALDGATNNWLRIPQALWQHRGAYILAATNALGEVSYRTVNVQIQHPRLELSVTSPTQPATNGVPPLQVTGLIASGPVILEASSDLLFWEPVLTNAPTAGTLVLQDTGPDMLNHRFYRVREMDEN